MQITTSIDLRGVLTRLKSLQTSPLEMKKALKVAAVGQIREVKTRTKKGIGLDGFFKPYSPFWVGVRSNPTPAQKKRYRSGGGHKTNIVNLNFSGRMLADMGVVKSTPYEAVISFHKKTEIDKAEGNQRVRPFMGITAKEQKQIVKRFKGALFK